MFHCLTERVMYSPDLGLEESDLATCPWDDDVEIVTLEDLGLTGLVFVDEEIELDVAPPRAIVRESLLNTRPTLGPSRVELNAVPFQDRPYARQAQEITDMREAKNVSRAKLAELSGYSYGYIRKLESGFIRVSARYQRTITKVLKEVKL